MAYPSMLLFALLLFTTTSIAHSYIINGTEIALVQINGLLVCSIAGIPLPGITGPPLAGVNVALSCNGGETTLSQALTNTSGFFEVVLNTLDGVLFDTSKCAIFIKLPLVGCKLFPPTGTLRSALSVLNIVPGLLGPVANLVIGILTRL